MAELRATYRLQLGTDLGFAQARELVPYLRDMGISHLYLSPVLQARSGSTHGYDVVDPGRISEELGGEAELRALAAAAAGAGMGIVLDVVPNHMAASEENRYWADRDLRERFFDLDPETGRYRRFFDIDDMAGVRQENPEVFEATHALTLRLLGEGVLDGLRVDHPDGLADPAGYLERLREKGAERVWVEKILDPSERLREWPVCGTVGYEFLNDVCALFVDPAGEAPLTALWQEVSGDRSEFGEIAFEAKLEQATTTFRPEVERLQRLAPELEFDRLAHALASLPIYRTYIANGRAQEPDREILAGLDPSVREVLLHGPEEFVTRFQQTTPAIMAKGVEDTAFYRYGRLLALNDVGGDPARFGLSVERFHAGCLERAARFPHHLLTTQTHDAKRSADVRARIGALASVADEWRSSVERMFELTQDLCADGAPDDVERYFIFQTLAGAWPFPLSRLGDYMLKALREAKRNTSWVEQNQDWEQAVVGFCRALYSEQPFLAELARLVGLVGPAGERAALGQLALKLTAPGVPDIYQGDELPFRALVDPDNRRPVDWRWHQAMLRRLMGGSPPVAETRKLFLILRLLGLRARRPELFEGAYEPLGADDSSCCFLRGDGLLVAVAVRPEAGGGLEDAPRGRWRDVLRGEERSFSGSEPLERIIGAQGVSVFERI